MTARAGSVRLAGREITRLRADRLTRAGVNFVPQVDNVFPSLSVAENLKVSVLPLSRSERADALARAETLFPIVRERARQRAGTLSGGEQQMVAIARALLNRDALLLVDEPTKGLAPRIVSEVAHVLERIAELTTVVLVEQNLAVLQRLAKHVVVLDGGRVVHEGPGEEVLDDPERVRRFLGVHGGGH